MLIEIAMGNGHLITNCGKTFLEPAGKSHRPMTSAGATNPHIHIAAALSLEERNEEFKEAFKLPDEGDGVRIGQYIVPHSRIFPGQWLEIGNEKRIP